MAAVRRRRCVVRGSSEAMSRDSVFDGSGSEGSCGRESDESGSRLLLALLLAVCEWGQ